MELGLYNKRSIAKCGMHKTTTQRIYTVSVPGSLMLFGEHAVLRGKSSVVAAIDQRITVQLTPRQDRLINIQAQNFGVCHFTLDNFLQESKFKFVTAAIAFKLRKIKSGFDLYIASDFTANLGLGSSAAVTVATLAVLEVWLKQQPYKPLHLCTLARRIVRQVQGLGSGADVAASVFGGVIAYRMQPMQVMKIAKTLPLTVIYSGSKIPTALVVKKVANDEKHAPKCYAQIFKAMDTCALAAVTAIKRHDLQQLGLLMNIHQGLHDALGVNTEMLSELAFALRKAKQVYGAKISGSGLGDCVIALGTIKNNVFPLNKVQKSAGVKQLTVTINNAGVMYDIKCLSKKTQL